MVFPAPSTRSTISRRRMLVGSAALGATWVAPSVVRIDRVAAAAGSCSVTSVSWSSVAGPVGTTYTATGTSGTLTITATIVDNVTGGAVITASGGQLLLTMPKKHEIADTIDVTLAFSDSSGGTVCTASSTILDIDRNGRGLGCATFDRYEANVNAIAGPGLVTTTFGNVVESPTGNFSSTLNCRTTDTENLGLSWTLSTGVTGAGFTYEAGTPPGDSPGASVKTNEQLIKLDPIALCVTAAAGAAPPGGAAAFQAPLAPLRFQVIEARDYD